MTQESELSSARRKELRNRHPLYTKLTGEVVWALLEEDGCAQDACGASMDAFLEQMRRVLAVMDSLEAGNAHYVVLRPPKLACERCKPFLRQGISTANPDWRRFLPPFGVGCSVECVALNAEQLQDEGKFIMADPTSHRRTVPCCVLWWAGIPPERALEHGAEHHEGSLEVLEAGSAPCALGWAPS